jgi:hypothetical protein
MNNKISYLDAIKRVKEKLDTWNDKGEIHATGTAHSIEYYMEEFEKEVLPKIMDNE